MSNLKSTWTLRAATRATRASREGALIVVLWPWLFVPADLSSTAPLAAEAPSQAAQTERFVGSLLQNRYALSVREGQFSGAGAPLLQSAIAKSRFVLIGEEHGVAGTPEFGTAVCGAAGPEPFRAMALEEGPLIAAELERWTQRPDGYAQLTAFEKTYPETFNVYKARGEFDMLQQCARAGRGEFQLWGLNQEMFGAADLILTRVLASGAGREARPALQQLLQKNEEASRKFAQSGRLFDLFMFTADDDELARAAALLRKEGSPEAQSLFASLVESHEINRTPPSEYGNARRRERLMKTRFAEHYSRAARNRSTPPKVLLKFGAFHGYRGLNPFHGSGIGNYVAEFAEGQGAQSLHIVVMAARGSLPIPPLIASNLLRSDWTLFDLRPLRQGLASSNTDVSALVFGYDLLVTIPEGALSTTHR